MRSIQTHLTAALLLCILIPTGLIGITTCWFVLDSIIKDRIENVGWMAAERHQEMRAWLYQDNERSKNFLNTLITTCRHSDNSINACAQTKLEQFANINHAVGLSFHSGIERDLNMGVEAIPYASFNKPLLPEQIAVTSSSKINGVTLYSIIVADSASGFSLVTTYSGQKLQNIFVGSPVLGQSGETFLADNNGFFITQPRYPAQQGIVEPIASIPMQHCLQKENRAMLGIDYRNTSIIHGFQFIPEIGGGCIMAHIDQKEAFAPLIKLAIGLIIAVFFFTCSAWFIAKTLSKNMTKPIMALADMAKALSQGDFTQRVFPTHYREIKQLSKLFNSMAGQLDYSLSQLKASEQALEQKIIERTAELQESETYLRAIFNATPDAMIINDKQGVITMLNRQAERLLGYSIDELLGQTIEVLIPERYRANHPALRANIATAAVIQSISVSCIVALCKDGRELDVEISLSPIKTEQGLFFASALRDITERKQTESLLRASEERFRRMANNTPVMIWITDNMGEPTFVNKSWLDFTGFDSLQTMTHENWISTIHPDDRETAFTGYYQNTDVHEAITTEYRLRHADGEWRWILDQGLPLFDGNGVFNGYIGSAIDITERKQVQQALQDKERMLSESQRIAHIGSWSIELETGRLSWSDEMYQIYGVTRETFGHSIAAFFNLIHPDDRTAMDIWFQDCLAGKNPKELDFRILLADGSTRFICGSGELQYDEMHRPLRIIGSAQDVTEHKEADKILHQIRAMIDISLDGFLIVDRSGQILQVNQAYAKMLGYSTDELMNKNIDQLKEPEEPEQVEAHIEKIIAQGYDLFETHHRHKDGHSIDMEISAAYLPEFQQFCLFCRDISERKHMELNLHIAAIAFQSQEPMVITDTASVILRINKAFTESTGYTEAEAVGQKINILKSGHHDRDFYTNMWENLLKNDCWQGEIWDRRKNGEIYPKWLSITAVKDSNGNVTHYVGTHVDITERKSAEDQIKQLAFYDPLTQLPNRRLLQEQLKHNINVERRDGRQFGLLMLDLDRFKAVNDSLGHLAGDELLQQVAVRIKTQLRDVDMVARLGGDEFIVLLTDITRPEDAARVAEGIVAELSQPFCLSQSDNVQIGASIGISLYPQHGDSAEQLIAHADAALYQAKDAGRGCFAYFSDELTLTARERIALETRLRSAIGQQELHIFYQPQIEIATGQMTGAEALIRWQDPEEGLIPPSLFIPIAEETGLILTLGEWVLRETCWQGRQWLDEGLAPIKLAVNVSAQQFRYGDICALVATVLAETNFPADQLELELTETGLMENQVNATDILNNLRAQGVHLAIDGFGTGYSSLAHLKHFPLNLLKIDKRSFHQDNMEIAATVIAMGHTLGFKVLAEGVETPEQLAFLQEKGCDLYQGYIKNRPLPAQEFAELLRAQRHSA